MYISSKGYGIHLSFSYYCVTHVLNEECMRQTTKLNKMNIHFVGGASCVDKNLSGECSNIHPYPDGGENGSKGKAPPVPVGDSQSQPGKGTQEDLRGYRMKNFLLAPGKGGKTENKTFSLNGGGGGGVLINGIGPTLSLLEYPTDQAPTKTTTLTTTDTKPTTAPTTKNTSTTTGTKSSVSTPSPNTFRNNGQGYGGGQGGSKTGNPGPGVVILEIVRLTPTTTKTTATPEQVTTTDLSISSITKQKPNAAVQHHQQIKKILP